jgi:flavin-dependent dehydrogenase
MLHKTNKIVIVGGGSAGWIVASTLIHEFPDRDITLIESGQIPTIGVGESTTPEIHTWLRQLEIDYDEFFVASEAIYKLNTQFNDFREKDGPSWVVPTWFGQEHLYYNTPDRISGIQDWHFKKFFYPETPWEDFTAYTHPQEQLRLQNKFAGEREPALAPFDVNIHSGLNLNAIKFAEYLSEKYAKPRGVKQIIATVKECIQDEHGIKELILENGEHISGDIFVDCTGFKSLLLERFLGEEFISTLDTSVPHDRAYFAPIEYTDKNKELNGTTTATALTAGWAWSTPLWSRLGTGYIYSSKFTDDESALKEFKAHLDGKNMTVHNPQRSQTAEIRHMKIKTGYHEKVFVKNVVAIGLSAIFVDALESNGLFFTHTAAQVLARTIQRPVLSEFDRELFNASHRDETKSFRDFIELHYILSQRNDSPYWNMWTSRSYETKAGSESRYFTMASIDDAFRKGEWAAKGHPIISTYTGMGYNVINGIGASRNAYLLGFTNLDHTRKVVDRQIEKRNAKIQQWADFAKTLPTQYEYLRDKYYGGKDE